MVKKRLIQLDILRAVAVFLVFGRHLPGIRPEMLEGQWWYGVFYRWQILGWVGVDLFFVLSGFLISGLLFREFNDHGNLNLLRFYIRRGLKIYPAFYVLIGICLIFGWADIKPGLINIVAELFYFQNYIYGIWGHTWSLAVEEHFYLLLGLLLFICVKLNTNRPFKYIPHIFAGCALLILLLRVLTLTIVPDVSQRFLQCVTHLRVDSLFFGVFLSYFHHYHHEAFKHFILKHKRVILLSSVLFILPITYLTIEASFFLKTIGLTLLYIGFGGFLTLSIYCLNSHDLEKNRITRTIGNIGVYSYSIYLWHLPVRYGVSHFVQDAFTPWLSFFIEVALFVGMSVGVGIAMSKLIEIPFLKYRDRAFISRSSILEK